MNWYYESSGQPVGPIPEPEFARLASAGTIAPDTLVWREGMAGWETFSAAVGTASMEVPPLTLAMAAPAAVTPGLSILPAAARCQVCGGFFPGDEVVEIAGTTVCGRCKPRRLQMLHEGATTVPGGLWRSGRTLVMDLHAVLPERCVHCNGTTNLRRLKHRLYWHHPAVYLAILANLLIYLIIALCVRKRADVEIYICQADLTRRYIKIAVSWLMILAVPISIAVLIADKARNFVWLIPPLLFIGAIVISALARLVHARKIDEKRVWVNGTCREFVADLPEWPG